MLILDTAGDTIRAEASAASSITVSCYGIETASGTDTFKRLGVAQLTGSGTQDTIYTVPASTSTVCMMIVIANTSASARTIKLWDVENGGSPGDTNAILGTVAIPANTSILWNKGNIKEIPTIGGGAAADEKVGIDSGATAGYLGAASGDGVLRTGAGLSYTDGGDFITLAATGGGHTLTAKTANYPLSADDFNGLNTFTNKGATGIITFTLLAGVDNYKVSFIVQTAEELRIDPNGSEVFVDFTQSGAAGKYISSSTVGTAIALTWDGAKWQITEIIGIWDIQS